MKSARAALAGCNNAGSSTLTPQPVSSGVDAALILGAGQASNAEIAAARLALQKTQNADVANLANEMITDHTGENAALAPLAPLVGTTAPAGVNAMQQATAQMLMTLTGTAFDAAYVNSEIVGHQMNLANNDTPEVDSGTNARVRAHAQTYQPQVAMHLQMWQALKAKDTF